VAKREGFSFIFLRFLLHSQGCIAKCLQGSEFSFTGWLKLTLPQYISGVRHLKPVEFPPPPDRCSLVYSTIFSNYRAMLCIARRMLSQYVCPSVRPTVRHTPLLCWNSKFRRLLRCAMRGACALRDAYGVIRRNTAYYCRMHMAYLRHASCMQDAMHHACRMQCIVVWTQHNYYY